MDFHMIRILLWFMSLQTARIMTSITGTWFLRKFECQGARDVIFPKSLICFRCQTNPDKGRFTRLKCFTCLPGSPTIFGSLCQQQCLGGGEVGGNMPHSDSLVGYGETFKDTFYFGTSKIQIVHSGYETIILSDPYPQDPYPQDHSLKQEPQYFLGSSLSYNSSRQ